MLFFFSPLFLNNSANLAFIPSQMFIFIVLLLPFDRYKYRLCNKLLIWLLTHNSNYLNKLVYNSYIIIIFVFIVLTTARHKTEIHYKHMQYSIGIIEREVGNIKNYSCFTYSIIVLDTYTKFKWVLLQRKM